MMRLQGMRRVRQGLAVAVLIGVCVFEVRAQDQGDFCGARGIIDQICVELPDEATSDAQKTVLPIAALREQAQNFAASAPDLPPEAAAMAWLGLVDQFNQLLDQPGSGANTRGISFGAQPTAFDLVVGALPPPSTWTAIADAVREREPGVGSDAIREQCLRLFAALLVNDEPWQFASLDTIKRLFSGTTDYEYYVRENARELIQLVSLMAARTRNPRPTIEAFEASVAHAVLSGDDSRLSMGGLTVPNLVPIAGEEEAARLLRAALRVPGSLTLTGDAATRDLASQLALSHIDEMTYPQWRLCILAPDTSLYDALYDRFVRRVEEARRQNPDGFINAQGRQTGMPDSHDLNRARQAATWHAMACEIIADRIDEARVIADDLTDPELWLYHMYGRSDRDFTATGVLKRSAHADRAFDLFAELLQDDPTRPLWQSFITLGQALGHQDQVLAAIDAVDVNALGDQLSHVVRTERRRLRLAHGRVDDLIAEHREGMHRAYDQPTRSFPSREANSLLELGQEIDRPELVAEAVDRLRELYFGRANHMAGRELTTAAMRLSADGRGSEAESILAELLGDHLARTGDESVRSTVSAPILLARLVQVYGRAGRHRDVLVLADEATWWGCKDIKDIQGEFGALQEASGHLPVPVYIASALIAVGRDAEARHILESMLDGRSVPDEAFAMLVELDGLAAIRQLDELHRRNQVDDRPLVWKARALLDAGQIDAAADLAQEALSLDPADEDGNPGWRLHGLSVLADAREAQGRDGDAERLRKTVRAVRLAESGLAAHRAGRIEAAIDAYHAALDLTNELYFVYSGLANAMVADGQRSKANAHYRSAFELIPGSVNHCPAFTEAGMTIGIASDVFEQRLERDPAAASTHYLIGRVRDAQSRPEEAVFHLRKALQLDPTYTRAAQRLIVLGQSGAVPHRFTDSAAAMVYAMTPLAGSWGGAYRLNSMHDLRRVWEAAAGIEPMTIPVHETVYVLAAAREQLEKAEAAAVEAGRQPGVRDGFSGFSPAAFVSPRTPTPGEAVAGHRVVQQIIRIYGTNVAR